MRLRKGEKAMDWDRVVESSLDQLDFYNNNQGGDLAPVFHGPSRARLANIAACLVDGNRFLRYLEHSSYWEADLITAARIYATNPALGIWRHEPEGYQLYLSQMRDRLLQVVPLRRIYQNPQRLNYRLDLAGVGQMLKQLWIEQEVAA